LRLERRQQFGCHVLDVGLAIDGAPQLLTHLINVCLRSYLDFDYVEIRWGLDCHANLFLTILDFSCLLRELV